MATLTASGITFGDGSSQSSVAPSAGGLGSYKWGMYIVGAGTPSGNDVPNIVANYGPGTTIGGGSLATDHYKGGSSVGNYPTGYMGPIGIQTRRSPGRVSCPFPSSPFSVNTGTAHVVFNSGTWMGSANASGANVYSYSTQSGSWRSMMGTSVGNYYEQYGNQSFGFWCDTLWVRYA